MKKIFTIRDATFNSIFKLKEFNPEHKSIFASCMPSKRFGLIVQETLNRRGMKPMTQLESSVEEV